MASPKNKVNSLRVSVHSGFLTESDSQALLEMLPLDLSVITTDIDSNNYRFAESAQQDPELDLSQVRSISDDPKFDRYSKTQKRLFVGIASISCFLAPTLALAFLPAVPEIAARFNTTGAVINISAAVYCIFMSLSPCLFSPLSDIYGRRPAFVACLVLFTVSTVLVAVSVNLAMFYVFRALLALFGTAFFSIGAHIIADIHPPVRRLSSMAMLILGAQVGSSLGGVLGGVIVNYTSWRVIFWFMAGVGGILVLVVVFLLPETAVETGHQKALKEKRISHPNARFVWMPLNPFRVVTALKYPNLSIDGFIVMALVFNMYALITPIRYVMDPRFHLTKPVYSGLFYIPPGVGYLVGSFFGGRWLDHVMKQWIKRRGRRVPEDRLRQILIPLGVVYPACQLIYGWLVDTKKGGVVVPVLAMFIGGIAQTCVFPASNTYCVDSMPELNGDAIGSSYFSRYLAGAVASATCLKSIDLIGVGWTCTISAAVLWAAFGCALVVIYWGEDMRVGALERYGLRPKGDLDRIRELRKLEKSDMAAANQKEPVSDSS